MKFRAFTLIEQLVVIIIIGSFAAILLTATRPGNIKKDAFKKVSKGVAIQIQFATKAILAKNTRNYSLEKMRDSSGEFSIAVSTSASRMIGLYKKHLHPLRNKAVDATYKAKELQKEDGSKISGVKPESFTGYILKNGAYFGIKLHGDCAINETYIYDPARPDMRTVSGTCGIIFIDVNEKEEPNILGIDQFIIPLGKYGVK